MPGSKGRPFKKNIMYYSKMSGKRSKILEKSGNFIREKKYEPWGGGTIVWYGEVCPGREGSL